MKFTVSHTGTMITSSVKNCRTEIVSFLFEHYSNVVKEWQGEDWHVTTSGVANINKIMDKVEWNRPERSGIVEVWSLDSEWFCIHQIWYWKMTTVSQYQTDTIIDIADDLLALQLKLMLS
jgi:hypothetical protein